MRIIAGRYGGRNLYVPSGRDIRPTSDKVRGAIFNMLQSRDAIAQARVADIFCGSGALGLEALSRGAATCMFIDKDRAALDAARRNAESFGLPDGEARFLLRDATKTEAMPPGCAPITLALLDPPYKRDFLTPALAALHDASWLQRDALCIAEVERDYAGTLPDSFQTVHERLYGDTKILVLRHAH